MIELRTLYMIREKSTFKLIKDWHLNLSDDHLQDQSLQIDRKIQRRAHCDVCNKIIQDWTDRFFTGCNIMNMPGESIFRKSDSGPLKQNDYCAQCVIEEKKKGKWYGSPYINRGRI